VPSSDASLTVPVSPVVVAVVAWVVTASRSGVSPWRWLM
jgi:hypothetical protein